MAQLTLSERALMAQNPVHLSKTRSKMNQKSSFWLQSDTPDRASVNKQIQKQKRYSKNLVLNQGYAESQVYKLGELFLTQYNVDPPVYENNDPTTGVLADSEYESAAFDEAFNYFAGVEIGDQTDLNIDW